MRRMLRYAGLHLAATLTQLAGLVAFYWGVKQGMAELAPAAIALTIGGAQLRRRANATRAPRAEEVLQRDPRPPVVYLRTFARDAPATDNTVLGFDNAIELQLEPLLRAIGPMIALSNPREPGPQPGAARIAEQSDEGWQQAVLELIERAALVVIHVGESPALEWEVEQTLRRVAPHRILLIADDARARAWLQPRLPHPLARVPVSRFIMFDAARRPRYLRRSLSPLDLGSQPRVLGAQLRPLFTALGVQYRRPRLIHPFLLWLLAAAVALTLYTVRGLLAR